MFRPIYEPRTRAREYCDLAINIYNGCNHGCKYCYARKMFERFHPGEDFSDVKVREGIVEAAKNQLSGGKYKGKKIMLCFMCDPYPAEIDTMPTREVIKAIKEAGAHVQILTKGGNRAVRDFDLLDEGDSFGITLSCLDGAEVWEPNAALPWERISTLCDATLHGMKTWVSFEPVIDPKRVLYLIKELPNIIQEKNILLRIGKLNHLDSRTNWVKFGNEAEKICKGKGWNYYIKEDLRAAMKI